MKIIAVERLYSHADHKAQRALESNEMPSPDCLRATLLTDSAVVRAGTPLFLPDFAAEGWVVEVVPVAVISRLGKWIEPRFAPRYYSRVGLAGRLVPASGVAEGAFAANFDGAFAPCGLMPEMSEVSADEALTLEVDGESVTIEPGMLWLPETVALCSRFMMLKTGDMIAPCRTGLRVTPRVGECITASLNGQELLRLKIR